jgi:hypothetical protein
MVLKVPMVSISMTVLKALGLRPEMGAMKLPAAPALWGLVSEGVMDEEWVLALTRHSRWRLAP